MCRGCDMMVHSANSLVGKHQRHLLTGWLVGLQPLPAPGEVATASGDASARSSDGGSVGATAAAAAAVPGGLAAERQQPAAPSSNGAAAATTGNKAKGKAGTNGRAGHRANGTADYEDYGALRVLLGYPDALPGAPAAPAKSTAAAGQQQKGGERGKAGASGRAGRSNSRASSAAAAAAAGGGSGGGAAGPGPFSSAAAAMADAARQGGGVSAVGGGGGASGGDNLPPGMTFPEVPNAVTLSAAELLGMPGMAGELSAKDVDAVFLPDSYTVFDDFDLDFSSLFAVPDLGPRTGDDSPTLGGAGLFTGMTAGMATGQPLGSGSAPQVPSFMDDDDGLVPVFGEPSTKRRRR